MGKQDFLFSFEMKDFDLLCRHALIQHKAPSQIHLFARLDLKGVNSPIITGFFIRKPWGFITICTCTFVESLFVGLCIGGLCLVVYNQNPRPVISENRQSRQWFWWVRRITLYINEAFDGGLFTSYETWWSAILNVYCVPLHVMTSFCYRNESNNMFIPWVPVDQKPSDSQLVLLQDTVFSFFNWTSSDDPIQYHNYLS